MNGRFAALCFIASITSIAAANWLVDRYGSNTIVVAISAAILAVFLILAIPPVDDIRTSRRREVSSGHPARPRGSLPSAGRLGRDSHAGGTPAQTSHVRRTGPWIED